MAPTILPSLFQKEPNWYASSHKWSLHKRYSINNYPIIKAVPIPALALFSIFYNLIRTPHYGATSSTTCWHRASMVLTANQCLQDYFNTPSSCNLDRSVDTLVKLLTIRPAESWDTDASLALWYHRIIETSYIDALFRGLAAYTWDNLAS